MDIREIHIDQFGVWQDVSIRALNPSMNVIHLADGGRPIDFARFLHATLFGFTTTSHQARAGSLRLTDGPRTLRLDRSADCNGEQTFGVTDSDCPEVNHTRAFAKRFSKAKAIFAEYFSIPTAELPIEKNWEWLSRNPAIARQLLDAQSQAGDNGLLSASRLSLSTHGSLLEHLAQQREQLLSDIAGMKIRVADAPPKLRVLPVSEIASAELKDELRMLERQITPLLVAVDLADRWQELMKLGQNDATKNFPDQLNDLLSEYRLLEAQKADWQEALTLRPRRKPAKKKTSDQQQVRKLLDQRDWVMAALDRVPLEEPLDFAEESYDELGHAGFLLESAKRESETAQGRLNEFSKRTGFDWSNLFIDEPTTRLIEISNDSPLAQEPPAIQLAELKRRRLWIREEHRHLIGQQEISTQTYIWIVILFTLSVASLFGTYLVVSTSTQWVLAAFGLGGIVSAGALKLSIELRASRQLNRTKDRLRQIDAEILVLTEQVLSEQQDAATARRRAEQKLHALQLQQDSIEANKRLDSAEVAFRELLELRGLPLTLTPAEATRSLRRQLRKESQKPSSSRGDGKLRRWTKRARDLIQRIDGIRPGKDPLELLATLELIFDQLRDVDYSNDSELLEDDSPHKRDEARRELKRIEKQQRLLLRRGKVEDQFELQAAIETAELQARNRQRVRTLELELSVAMESHEDGEDIRELLEMFDVDELRVRLSERMHIQEETRVALREQQAAKPTVSKQLPIPIEQQELDRTRLRLSVVETQIRHVMRQAQAATVLKHVARTLANKPVEEQAFGSLYDLTDGRWSSIQFIGDRFELKGPHGEVVLLEESDDAEPAWLAVQLNAAKKRSSEGESLPLVLLADTLFARSDAAKIYDVLRNVCDHGVQVLLLAGNRQLVNQLAEAGTPVVRVGLREQQPRDQQIARVSDLSHLPDVRPRLAQF